MTTIHNNKFNLEKGRGISSITFKFNGDYIVSDGQPWGDITSSDGHIVVAAGRHGSKKCAEWFKEYVNSAYINMIHTRGGDNLPSKLNFAIKGELTINGYSFNVCIGQGHRSGSDNNWHIASRSIEADADAKNGEIGDGIRMSQDGTYAFKLSTSRTSE